MTRSDPMILGSLEVKKTKMFDSMNGMMYSNNLTNNYTDDRIKLITTENPESVTTDMNNFWKYDEGKTLKDVEEYLKGTYHSHYTSESSKTQVLDLIESIGDSEPFCRSNAIKYLSRFGKKNGKSKLDLLKAIHYCILLFHFSGVHKNTSSEYKTF